MSPSLAPALSLPHMVGKGREKVPWDLPTSAQRAALLGVHAEEYKLMRSATPLPLERAGGGWDAFFGGALMAAGWGCDALGFAAGASGRSERETEAPVLVNSQPQTVLQVSP